MKRIIIGIIALTAIPTFAQDNTPVNNQVPCLEYAELALNQALTSKGVSRVIDDMSKKHTDDDQSSAGMSGVLLGLATAPVWIHGELKQKKLVHNISFTKDLIEEARQRNKMANSGADLTTSSGVSQDWEIFATSIDNTSLSEPFIQIFNIYPSKERLDKIMNAVLALDSNQSLCKITNINEGVQIKFFSEGKIRRLIRTYLRNH